MRPLYRQIYCALSAALTLVGLAACDVVAPERLINDAARPPEVIAFEALRSDLRYAGTLEIYVSEELAPFRGAVADLFIDGEPVRSCPTVPCTLGFETTDYSEGPHTLSLNFRRTRAPDATVGLGALLGLGAVVLRDTVVFDQSPPEPVTIVATTWTEAGVRVRWESPTGANLNARQYQIIARRYSEQTGPTLIVEAPATEALDSSPELVMGDRLEYTVIVTNGVSGGPSSPPASAVSEAFVATASPSFWQRTACGEDGGTGSQGPDYATALGSDQLLALCSTGYGSAAVIAYSLTDRTVSEPLPLGPLPSGGPFAFDLVASPTGSYVVVAYPLVSPGQPLLAAPLDPSSRRLGAFVPLSGSGAVGSWRGGSNSTLGSDGRLYIIGASGSIYVFDVLNGDLLQTLAGTTAPTGSSAYRALRHLSDDWLVYLDGYEVFSFDLRGRPALRSARVPNPYGARVEFTGDASGRLYRRQVSSASPTLDVVDPASLSVLRSFTIQDAPNVNGFWGGLEEVYVMSCENGQPCSLIRIASDGTEIGRRPVVGFSSFFPSSVPGRFFLDASLHSYLDSIPR